MPMIQTSGDNDYYPDCRVVSDGAQQGRYCKLYKPAAVFLSDNTRIIRK